MASAAAIPPTRTKTFEMQIPLEQMGLMVDYLIGVLEQNKFLSGLVKVSTPYGINLQYRLGSNDGSILDVEVRFFTDRVEIYYSPYPPNSVSEKELVNLDLELETVVRSYFSSQSRASLFLVFSPKMKLIPPTVESRLKRLIGSVMLGNFVWIFVIFLTVGIFLFSYFGMWTPLILVVMQFVFVLFAGRFLRFRGEFEITRDNPSIFIAELRMRRSEFENVMATCIPKIAEIKKKIYEATLGRGKDLDEASIVTALNDQGVVCQPEYVRIKGVNVFNLVNDLGASYGLKEPNVTLLNILTPNAAATGISPSAATVMVTSGLIATMSEEEIKSVLAHEFSHVKARDPLVLLSLASLEYLLRVYVIWPVLPGGIFIDLVYLFLAFTAIFFIAKFLEARADLDAAKFTQKPRVLAGSLRKLGLYKYQSHAFELIHAGEWVNWDTHPPLYYRIRTLENLNPAWLNHTFISAIRGCMRGFYDALKGR